MNCYHDFCNRRKLKTGLYCGLHSIGLTAKQKRTKPKKYKSLEDVKCPICNGVINSKWFNFRTKNVVEFVAECWSGIVGKPNASSHVFYFQIEVPPCVLIYDKSSKVFDE